MLFVTVVLILSHLPKFRMAAAVGAGAGMLSTVFTGGILGVPVRLTAAMAIWLFMLPFRRYRRHPLLFGAVSFVAFALQSALTMWLSSLMFGMSGVAVSVFMVYAALNEAFINSILVIILELSLNPRNEHTGHNQKSKDLEQKINWQCRLGSACLTDDGSDLSHK